MNVAFVPVRGGSKSIPLKNIKEIAGKPLVYWVLNAANSCDYLDEIYVATDSDIIKNTVNSFNLQKVRVIDRSAETATDSASTESAMLEFASKYRFDNIMLIQATSPLLTCEDLTGGLELFFEKNADSVLSVVRQKRFNWKVDSDGIAEAVNYDMYNRPRRQDFDGYFVENGAFYITSRERLLESQNRLSGRVCAYEMDEVTYFEIDEPSDWVIVEHQLNCRNNKIENVKEEIPASEIEIFLTDCDGCLTDGGMYYSENGDEMKKFSAYDGMGFQLLRNNGIITGIITGEDVQLNRRRAEKLKLDYLIEGCKDKVQAVRRICEERGVDASHVAYMGDDINDLELLKEVGISFAPANAHERIIDLVTYVTSREGGQGAVREAIEELLRRR